MVAGIPEVRLRAQACVVADNTTAVPKPVRDPPKTPMTTGIIAMNKAHKLLPPAGLARHKRKFAVELARGGSHIASTLTVKSQHAAIAEVISDFLALHGADELDGFLELLAAGLDAREKSSAAIAVRSFDRESVVADAPGSSSPGSPGRGNGSAGF